MSTTKLKHIPFTIDGRDYIADIIEKGNKDWVSIKPICEAMGIKANTQAEKLKRNKQFSYTLIGATGQDGKRYQMVSIPVEEIGMWLCNINSRRVKKSVSEILVKFQRHCQVELHAAITGKAGIERVRILEERVQTMQSQINVLTESQRLLNETVRSQDNEIRDEKAKRRALEYQMESYNQAERLNASVAGKMMARARKTKHLRVAH